MYTRYAVEADFLHVVSMCEMLHAESAYRYHPFSEDAVRSSFARCLVDPDFVGIVLVGAERVEGVIGAFIQPMMFSKAKVARDLLWYIAQDHRSLEAVKMLVGAYEQWAVEQGADEITLGISENMRSGAIARLCEMMGYGKQASLFVKETDR